MTLVFLILLSVSIILLGAAVGKPLGWVAIGLALLAFLIAVVGAPGLSFR
jgi:uncharacterized membrane protein